MNEDLALHARYSPSQYSTCGEQQQQLPIKPAKTLKRHKSSLDSSAQRMLAKLSTQQLPSVAVGVIEELGTVLEDT